MESIIVTNGVLRPNSKNKAEQTLDGEYFISPPDKLWNGKPFYSRIFEDGSVQGLIFFDDDGSRWKICCLSDFYGWNLSERVEDPSLPFPPLGQWKGGGDDCPANNDYKAVFTAGCVSVKPAKRKD